MDYSGSCKGWEVVYNQPIGIVFHGFLYHVIVLALVSGLYNPYHPLQEPEYSIDTTWFKQWPFYPQTFLGHLYNAGWVRATYVVTMPRSGHVENCQVYFFLWHLELLRE